MHLTDVCIENFRVFKKKSYVDLAPLTFFVGQNNSGKSSLIKLMLLLKDTFDYYKTNPLSEDSYLDFYRTEYEKHNFPFSLIFNNKSGHNLGNFNDVLCNQGYKKELTITLPFLIPEFKDNVHGQIELVYEKCTQENLNILKKFTIKTNKTSLLEISNIDYDQHAFSVRFNYSLLISLFKKGGLLYKIGKYKGESDEINFGFQKYNSERVDIRPVNMVIDEKQSDCDSSYDNFGRAEYKHLHCIDESQREEIFTLTKPWWPGEKFTKEDEVNYLLELRDLEKDYFDEHTNEDGFLIFTESKITSQLPSIRSLIIENFERYLSDAYYAGKNKNALGSFWGFKSYRTGKKAPKGIPIRITNYGTFIISLIDRAIHFNLCLYSETFSGINLYPNLDLRFEKLIDKEDGVIFNLLESKLFFSNDEKKILPDSRSYAKNFIKVVLSELGLADDIKVEKYKNYGYEILILKKGKIIPISNFGYGIRKLLTLILRIAAQALENSYEEDIDVYYNPSVLLIEEPESNLHPKLQSFLADLFEVAARNFNIQFIVETHSEYLIRKIQYLVAENETKVSSKDVSIYYFDELNENNKCVLRRIEIRPDGILKQEFGSGFYDESIKWTMKLLNLSDIN